MNLQRLRIPQSSITLLRMRTNKKWWNLTGCTAILMKRKSNN